MDEIMKCPEKVRKSGCKPDWVTHHPWVIKVNVTFWSADSSYSKVNLCERGAVLKPRDLTAWVRPPGSCLELWRHSRCCPLFLTSDLSFSESRRLLIVVLMQCILTKRLFLNTARLGLFSLTRGRFMQNKASGRAPVWRRQHAWSRCVDESCSGAASKS